MKKTKIIYWTVTILFSLMMIADGIAGLMQPESGKEAFRQLGYPYYVMSIVGAAKLIGGLVLLQNKFKTLKEWAFAGFAINFLGASASWALSGGPTGFVSIPLVMLAVLFLLYYYWKQYEQLPAETK